MTSATSIPNNIQEYEARIVADAVSWTAFLFVSRDRRFKTEHQTRDEATASARKLAQTYNKPALIYAISSEGRSAPIETIRPAR